MARIGRMMLAAVLLGLVVAAPLLYASHRQHHLRNFRVVEPGVLVRSGQLTPAGLERVLHDYRIKAVITLRTSRDPHVPPPDTWEADLCARYKARHVRIVPRVWSPDEKGGVPAEEGIKEFLRLMDDPANHPVLVHCFAGIHRTGTMCAIYRMEYDRWTVDQAKAEMQAFGYDLADLHEHVDTYLRAYRPRWQR
jgi:tyrosine-protein phosphatase SIW14